LLSSTSYDSKLGAAAMWTAANCDRRRRQPPARCRLLQGAALASGVWRLALYVKRHQLLQM